MLATDFGAGRAAMEVGGDTLAMLHLLQGALLTESSLVRLLVQVSREQLLFAFSCGSLGSPTR